ncbi:MAG: translation initiation factor IF-2 [Planctomycetota bacterium]|nr:translation initiation factor IF-2 [Planctomycetota bacterium]
MAKVKVHALAKQYGFKSTEFVKILGDIGFPVSSYQASIEDWDLPVIDERLKKGGLIGGDENSAETQAEEASKSSSWDSLMKSAATTDTEEVEKVEKPTTESVEDKTEPAADEVVSETPQPAPASESPKPKPNKSPTPKPDKKSATRVGIIDLEALGIIKQQQEERNKSGGQTFTDRRDRETSRRRDMKAKALDRLRDRLKGMLRNKAKTTVERKGEVVLESPVTLKSFSAATGISVNRLMHSLMSLDMMVSINTQLDSDTIELLADEFEIQVRIKEKTDIEKELMQDIFAARHAVDEDSMAPRPPVLAFMGHVDHGKTSLIDAIRETRVANREAGGITQHVGAYMAELDDGRKVTILDTPGHAAFTQMRKRGASATDIAILVVAADDGVMPQTEEAASHARAAGTPIVVAINKVDAQGANVDQVKSQLSGIGLQPEDWGGDVGMIEVSALHKTGIDELLERVMLEAEILDLKAHAKGDALGIVLESKLVKGKGKVASVLVQDGTLKVKQTVLVGHTYGNVRLMFDHNNKPAKEVGPGTPVDILGLDDFPSVGETFYVVNDMRDAKRVAEKRLEVKKAEDRGEGAGVTLANLFDKIDESNAQRLRLIVKADVQGSLEVLCDSLKALSTNEVIVDIVHSAVGAISDTDITLAETAEAVVLGFNSKAEGKAKKHAERVNVEIRHYDVVYELLEDITKAIEGMLAPDTIQETIGRVEILEVFRSSRWGTIAGCRVLSGAVKRACYAKLVRDGKQIVEGYLGSLRHFKDDVREVAEGNECGMTIEGFDDYKSGDLIEIIEIKEVARSLDEVSSKESGDENTQAVN